MNRSENAGRIASMSFPADPVTNCGGVATRSILLSGVGGIPLARGASDSGDAPPHCGAARSEELPQADHGESSVVGAISHPGGPSPSGQKASPRSVAETTLADSFPLPMGADGGRDASDLDCDRLPCAVAEAVSVHGSSAIHGGGGIWFAIVPGIGSGWWDMGDDRPSVEAQLSELALIGREILAAETAQDHCGTVPPHVDHSGTKG